MPSEGSMAETLKIRLDNISKTFIDHGLEEQITWLFLPSDSDEIMKQLQEFWESQTDPLCLLSVASLQTLYTARTIAGLDLSDQISLVGFGESEEAIRYVQNGVIKALAIQDTQKMRELAVQKNTPKKNRKTVFLRGISFFYFIFLSVCFFLIYAFFFTQRTIK